MTNVKIPWLVTKVSLWRRRRRRRTYGTIRLSRCAAGKNRALNASRDGMKGIRKKLVAHPSSTINFPPTEKKWHFMTQNNNSWTKRTLQVVTFTKSVEKITMTSAFL